MRRTCRAATYAEHHAVSHYHRTAIFPSLLRKISRVESIPIVIILTELSFLLTAASPVFSNLSSADHSRLHLQLFSGHAKALLPHPRLTVPRAISQRHLRDRNIKRSLSCQCAAACIWRVRQQQLLQWLTLRCPRRPPLPTPI